VATGNVTTKPLRVLVVDDRAMPRIAAKAMLTTTPEIIHVGEAASGTEALELAKALRPDLVLMDVEMAGMDGAETTRRILELLPTVKVLAWTVSDATDDLLRMIDAGCVGYVLKDVGPDELHRAIQAALRREAPVPRRMVPEVLRRASGHARYTSATASGLTEREIETLRLIARGMPTKAMASEMHISKASVDTHLRNVYRKLGVNNRGEAVSLALKAGLIGLSDL